jgi:Mn-dependent DtxR family transcriptional regulator
VLTERSVSRAAIRLGMHQPAVSAALKRLRDLAGDPLLVRSGTGMVPTDAGLRMIEPSASILRAAEVMFTDARGFDPQSATTTFRVAASDYLDPLFLPQLCRRSRPRHRCATSRYIPYRPIPTTTPIWGRATSTWWWETGLSHQKTCTWALFDDEVVSLVSADHPASAPGLGR